MKEATALRDPVSSLTAFDKMEIDHRSIPQHILDLTGRRRKSLFPWRGQFSPELIETFLVEYATKDAKVLDTFAGSGTTLVEAARRQLSAVGSEINPAAYLMAAATEFVNLDVTSRDDIIQRTDKLVVSCVNARPATSVSDLVPDIVNRLDNLRFERNLVENALLRAMPNGEAVTGEQLLCALRAHASLIRRLPYSCEPIRAFLSDARSISLPDASIDLIVTSPPYINVFNYHQNYRVAAEILKWRLLEVAKSEFGSNRKHRGNRFLTVVQYAMDLWSALSTMRRLICPNGRVIIVVGKESAVRGVRFPNGRLLAALALHAGFTLESRQERSFRSKFGERIFEDILHLRPSMTRSGDVELARRIGVAMLELAASQPALGVLSDLTAAIDSAKHVQPSPLFDLGHAKA